jgi:hypothetical protein
MSKIAPGVAASALLALTLIAASPAHASIVQNGSFESLTGPFVNNGGDYMQLADGSTIISNWTVSTTVGHIVLALTPTGEGYHAADGSYFLDLSGFGAESLDGAVSQTISTVAGATYSFSMDVASFNNGTVFASVGGNLLTLSSGAAFSVAGTSWTPLSGAFTGDALNSAPVLKIGNGSPGSQIDFVDNISIVQTSGGNAIPEPAGWAMMILGFGGVGATLRRRRVSRRLAA